IPSEKLDGLKSSDEAVSVVRPFIRAGLMLTDDCALSVIQSSNLSVRRPKLAPESIAGINRDLLSRAAPAEGSETATATTSRRGYSNNVSTRCACTISSHGDHAKTVKRPSCEATSATESR